MNAAKSTESQATGESEVNKEIFSELEQPIWAVATYEDVAAVNLTYDEALKVVSESDKRNVSGLCIITVEAAARIFDKK